MATWSSSRSSVAMICARAAPDGDFKACCMQAGRYDGANRNDYFQGVRAAESPLLLLVRDAEPLTPSPRWGEGRDEGAPAVRFGIIVTPSPRPSPLRGEGVKRRARLTVACCGAVVPDCASAPSGPRLCRPKRDARDKPAHDKLRAGRAISRGSAPSSLEAAAHAGAAGGGAGAAVGF
jgi:hypothetical protein